MLFGATISWPNQQMLGLSVKIDDYLKVHRLNIIWLFANTCTHTLQYFQFDTDSWISILKFVLFDFYNNFRNFERFIIFAKIYSAREKERAKSQIFSAHFVVLNFQFSHLLLIYNRFISLRQIESWLHTYIFKSNQVGKTHHFKQSVC